MTRNLSLLISGIILAAVVLFAGATFTQAASSLFGAASMGPDHVILTSNLSDNPSTTTNDFSGISFNDAAGIAYGSLTNLSSSYNVTDDDCGGGSPRFQIQIDTNGDFVSDGNVMVSFGPSPSFTNCALGWQTTGNVIGNADAGRYDYSAFGGSPFTTYSNMPTSVASGTVRNISIVVDGGWSADATGGDSEQTVLIDNVAINSTTYAFEPAPVTVTIVKRIDGAHASSTNATSSFPVNATWSSTSTGSGSGSFSLGPTGFNNPSPYEATTASMTSGASYSLNEVTSTSTGSVVGPDCASGQAYRLVGYSTGDSRALAASSTVSTTSPSLTNITTNKFVYVWNAKCVPPTATSSLKVHILKYLDGQKATAASSSSFMFPMTATWNSSNLNGGATTTGSFVLGNNHGGAADQYGADTAPMDSPANYSTSEVTATSSGTVLPIGSACETGKYRLLGYKTSAVSFADAASQTLSTSSPSFWALNSDRYVIVLNEKCGSTTPPPPPTGCAATSTQTFVSNAGDPVVGGGSAVAVATSSAWTASIPGATWIWQASSTAPNQTVGFEQTFTATGTVLSVQLTVASDNNYKVFLDGVQVAADSNLDNFSSGNEDSYNFTATTTPGTHTLRIEVTNFGTFNASGNPAGLLYKLTVVNCPPTTTPPPPPQTSACAATSAPSGYTLMMGTVGNDTVTLAPNTMYVDPAGNDKISGPNGNYIICSGSGNDTIRLGSGQIWIDSGTGNDTISIGSGTATIITGTGNDKVTTGNGDKNVSTGSGNDKVTTGSGNDSIDAGNGNNTVDAGGGTDSITAGNGNDIVNGGAGTDTCNADGGNNNVSNCEL